MGTNTLCSDGGQKVDECQLNQGRLDTIGTTKAVCYTE